MNNIAYCAGLFEGEGFVTANKYYYHEGKKNKRNSPQISLGLRMSDTQPLDHMFETFGGRITGPYEGTNKLMYLWTQDTQAAFTTIIALMWDYLSDRRKEQILNALEVRHPVS